MLESCGLDVQLVNAGDIKNAPGRPKTGKLDAVWQAKLTERGMLRPSFVPPAGIRRLRDYTRLRTDLTGSAPGTGSGWRSCWKTPQIKLSSVASNIFGVSGRQMLAAMLAGQHDPKVLARMAHGRMRRKIPQLQEVLSGQFTGHHAFLCQMMPDRIDDLSARIDQVTARIDDQIAPYARGGATG